jgi:hypothetical protein
MPGDEIFGNRDFNLIDSKKSTVDIFEQSNNNLNDEEMDEETDADEDESEDDFVEVKLNRSKSELEEDRQVEMKFLGFGSTTSENKNDTSNFRIDLNLYENEDNKEILQTMRDIYKELKYSYLTKVTFWIKTFSSVKNGTNDELKKSIEIKNSIQSIIKKCTDLKLPLESVNKSPLKKKEDSRAKINMADVPCTSKSCLTDENEEFLNEKELKRREMLKLAPVINFHELDYYSTPLTHKVETSHPLYQRREAEELLESKEKEVMEAANRLTKKPFIGKFEPVKWSCRAPLKNGKLCPRMDRYKCPIHGKIVARDELGNIVNESDRLENEKSNKQINAWEDDELIADINSATGNKINTSKNKKGQKRSSKKLNITDLKKESNTTKSRLEKKLLDPKQLRKVGSIMESIERKQYYEKFHHNYNYSISQ